MQRSGIAEQLSSVCDRTVAVAIKTQKRCVSAGRGPANSERLPGCRNIKQHWIFCATEVIPALAEIDHDWGIGAMPFLTAKPAGVGPGIGFRGRGPERIGLVTLGGLNRTSAAAGRAVRRAHHVPLTTAVAQP